jgi:hypothetical protein
MELEYTPILFEFRRCDAAYSYRPSRIPDDPCRSSGTRALTLVRATKSGGRGGRRGGLLSTESACAMYALSLDELLSWRGTLAREGLRGLKIRLKRASPSVG